jgi:hypothetical protein
MTILAILLAALLGGATHFTVHAKGVAGTSVGKVGGAVPVGGMTVDDVSSGGPTI